MKKFISVIAFFLLSQYLFSQNHTPMAVNDYVTTFRGHAIVNVLVNDYDVDGDTIKIFTYSIPYHGTILKILGNFFEYNASPTFMGGRDSVKYSIRDGGTPNLADTGWIFFNVDNPLSFDSVANNNINAGVNADGLLFAIRTPTFQPSHWNFGQKFEVPKGSGIFSIFSGSFWIGGIDSDDSLHVAADLYHYYGEDFWPGPVSAIYDSMYDYKFKRLWKITKSEIDYHITHCWQSNYTPAKCIIDWPANGDVTKGQSAIIAPFFDNNDDGIYDPYSGDYPLIKGDECVFFLFNDDRFLHTDSDGKKLGVEVRAMLYAFDCPKDSALWNTVFLNFKIVNRSSRTYHNTYIGTFFDNELGFGSDDLIGCDVKRGSYYCYNGDDYDETSMGEIGYGKNPPAQSVTVLGGPFIYKDGIDNPSGNCDEGINGLNFGNNIIDDERYGLSVSGTFWGTGGYDGMTVPRTSSDFYNYLQGYWKDSIQMHYWGNGHPIASGNGPVCRYIFPGNSDPCNYGTWGINPGGIEPWTEEQSGNQPYQRRSYGSSGPFTFSPGNKEELDLAFVFGRNFADSNAKAAITILQQRIDSIRSYFINDLTPCGEKFSGYKPNIINSQFLYVYPNPSSNAVIIEFAPGSYTHLQIYDMLGNLLISEPIVEPRKHSIDISNFRSGVYFIKVDDGNIQVIKKIIKIKQ